MYIYIYICMYVYVYVLCCVEIHSTVANVDDLKYENTNPREDDQPPEPVLLQQRLLLLEQRLATYDEDEQRWSPKIRVERANKSKQADNDCYEEFVVELVTARRARSRSTASASHPQLVGLATVLCGPSNGSRRERKAVDETNFVSERWYKGEKNVVLM